MHLYIIQSYKILIVHISKTNNLPSIVSLLCLGLFL